MRTLPVLMSLLVAGPLAFGASEPVTLTFDQPQTAGISGHRVLWDQPVVLTEDSATRVVDKGAFGSAPSAVWTNAGPGALAFDAVHRSLLVRFPQVAEKIAGELKRGQVVTKAELVLPFHGTELWPEFYLDPAGLSFLGDAWVKQQPRWHAVAFALRKPWTADAQRGPTFNAAINGQLFWAKYGAQDTTHDRYPQQFGPAEVSVSNTVGRVDVTGLFNDTAYGKTPADRLRQFADCGLLVRKWEIYDAAFWRGGYEWGTATGPRGILVETPRLEVTFGPAAENRSWWSRWFGDPVGKLAAPAAPSLLEGERPREPLATANATIKENGSRGRSPSNKPTAVLPTADEIQALAARLAFQKPDWMPDWQWQRVQELEQLGGVTEFPSTPAAYEQWIDQQLGVAPRRWSGFDAADRVQLYFKYAAALPAPVKDHWRLYWWAWLLPDRPYPTFAYQGQEYQFAQGYIGGQEAQAYYEQTRDWRGNFSVYRTYCHAMGTMNFNHWAVAGTLLGGAILGSDICLTDGRRGLEQWPLRTWCWYDGSTQESIDHYYFAHSLAAQKVFADFGPTPLDRLMGQSIIAKSVEELTATYHPGLRRFVSSSGRTGIAYVLGIQDGLQHIVHTLSPAGAYTDFGVASVTASNVVAMPVIGHDFKPGLVAEQTLNGPWAADWVAHMVDDKPLPFESTVTYKMWGAYNQTPLWKRSYQGRHYGLASLDVSVGNETVPVLAQWRRTDQPAGSMTDLGTLLIRPGINRTELLDSIYHDTPQRNPNGGVGTQGSHIVTLQHQNKAVVLTSPFAGLAYPGGRPVPAEVTSVQTTVGLFNFTANPGWELYVDGQRVTQFPATAKFGQRITIKDGVTFIGLIPFAAADFPRTAEVEIVDDGVLTEMQGGGQAREALRINAYLVKSATPLDAGMIEKLDLGYAGYVVELADATEYPDFAAFQHHLRDAQLERQWDAATQTLEVVYQSGSDKIECAYKPGYAGDWNKKLPTDQCFPVRKVNGAWPYPPAGVERDTTLTQITRTGRVEKNGAVLVTEPGKTAYLVTEPGSQTFAAWNPFPDPTDFHLTLPGGVELKAEGKLNIARIMVQPDRMAVDCAPSAAKQLRLTGREHAPAVTVNGQPVTIKLDGLDFIIPLP